MERIEVFGTKYDVRKGLNASGSFSWVVRIYGQERRYFSTIVYPDLESLEKHVNEDAVKLGFIDFRAKTKEKKASGCKL